MKTSLSFGPPSHPNASPLVKLLILLIQYRIETSSVFSPARPCDKEPSMKKFNCASGEVSTTARALRDVRKENQELQAARHATRLLDSRFDRDLPTARSAARLNTNAFTAWLTHRNALRQARQAAQTANAILLAPVGPIGPEGHAGPQGPAGPRYEAGVRMLQFPCHRTMTSTIPPGAEVLPCRRDAQGLHRICFTASASSLAASFTVS